MFTPKPLSPESLDAALAKAKQYRLLNEPMEAESISLDILEAKPDHQSALTMLLLAITDQFTDELSGNVTRASSDLRHRNLYFASESVTCIQIS